MFFTQETPAKVLSLLGVSMFSLFLLFGVSFTNANFSNTEIALPDIFGPSNVVSVLDNASNSYSKFLQTALIEPVKYDYALAADNIAFVIDEASPSILALTGFTDLGNIDRVNTVWPAVSQTANLGMVAGAYTEQLYYESSSDLSIDSVYYMLVGQY